MTATWKFFSSFLFVFEGFLIAKKVIGVKSDNKTRKGLRVENKY